MAGHGSPPAEDRANHPGRQVSRNTASSLGWAGTQNPRQSPLQGPWTPEHALASDADANPPRRRTPGR